MHANGIYLPSRHNKQAFINQSFENITSIEHSLKLLHKFQSILQRESLKSDLDSKLNIIFQVRTPPNFMYFLYLFMCFGRTEASMPPLFRSSNNVCCVSVQYQIR